MENEKKEVEEIIKEINEIDSEKLKCLLCGEKDGKIVKKMLCGVVKEVCLCDECNARLTGLYGIEAYRVERELLNRLEPMPTDWEGLIDRVESFKKFGKNDVYYEIKICGESIVLKEDEILNSQKFRQAYFKLFNILLPPNTKEWHEFLTVIGQKKILQSNFEQEEVSEEMQVVEEIVKYIENSHITKDITKTFNMGLIFVENNKIYVPSIIIEKILKQLQIKITLRKLSFLLRDYLAENTKLIRIKKTRARFWVFDAKKFDIENALVIEEDENKEQSQGEINEMNEINLNIESIE
jgi:hypothetical protein